MPDNFEKAKDKILKEARVNGGVTTDHLLDALIATNEDLDQKLALNRKEAKAKHDETRAWHDEVTGLVEAHIEEAETRDRRLDKLEEWRAVSMTTCEERVRKLAREEHHTYHGEYVASLGDRDFQGRLIWFFANTFGKVVLVVIGLVAGILLNVIVYGRP